MERFRKAYQQYMYFMPKGEDDAEFMRAAEEFQVIIEEMTNKMPQWEVVMAGGYRAQFDGVKKFLDNFAEIYGSPREVERQISSIIIDFKPVAEPQPIQTSDLVRSLPRPRR